MSRYIRLILFIIVNFLSLCSSHHKSFKDNNKSESVCKNMMLKSVTVKLFQHDIMMLHKWKMNKELMAICQKIANDNNYPISNRRLSILTIISQTFILGSKFESKNTIFKHNNWFSKCDIYLFGLLMGPELDPIQTFPVNTAFVLSVLPNKHGHSPCEIWIRLSRKISLNSISNIFNGRSISHKPVRVIRQIVIENGYNKSDPWTD